MLVLAGIKYPMIWDYLKKCRLECKSWNAQVDESLRKICHYEQNVPQHYGLLDTLV